MPVITVRLCTCFGNDKRNWPHGFLELELQKNLVLEHYHLENGEEFQRFLRRDLNGKRQG